MYWDEKFEMTFGCFKALDIKSIMKTFESGNLLNYYKNQKIELQQN